MRNTSTTSLWSEDPRILLESPFEFMYSERFDQNRNLNAMVRFVIYWSVIVYALTRHAAVFVVAVVALVLLRRPSLKVAPIITDNLSADSQVHCQSPSLNNPLANPTPADYGSGEAKLPACPTEHVKENIDHALSSQPITGPVHMIAGSDDSNSKMARRTFYSVPSSGVPDGRENFLNSLYGGNISRAL